MKKTKSISAIKQPILWRQAISQSKFGKLGWKNFYLYPLTKWLFSFKKHESALFDTTIIGSNPILTQLLLIKLYETAKLQEQKLNVALYFTGNDYWSYHLFEDEKSWKFLEHELEITLGKSFAEFCMQYQHIFTYLKITIINSQNNSISYYQKDEQYSKGYVFHLKKEEYLPNSFEKAMPHVNIAENSIRLKYLDQYTSFLNYISKENYNIENLFYSNHMQKNRDSDEKTHILLSNDVYLTSLAYWLNCETSVEQIIDYEGKKYYSTVFLHNLSATSYGTAIHTANDFSSLEHQSLEDFIQLYKCL